MGAPTHGHEISNVNKSEIDEKVGPEFRKKMQLAISGMFLTLTYLWSSGVH